MDLNRRIEEFDGRCAYCLKEYQCFDHFIAMSNAGSNTLDNLVSCYVFCNLRKWSHDPYEWYKTKHYFSEARWQRILDVLGKTQENYQQVTMLSTEPYRNS